MLNSEEVIQFAHTVSEESAASVARQLRAAAAGWSWNPQLVQHYSGLMYAADLVEALASSIHKEEQRCAEGRN